MKILFLSRWFPFPPDNGSKLRVLAILRGLAVHHSVTLLSFADVPDAARDASDLRSICEAIRVVRWQDYNPDSPQARLGYLSRTPRSLIDTFSTEMQQTLESMLSAEDFDLVIGSQLNALNYAQSLCRVPALLEESELGVFYGAYANAKSHSLQRRLRTGLTWLKLRHYMTRQMKCFRAATVASQQEHRLLQEVAPDLRRIEVIPNCISATDYVNVLTIPQPNSLIFTGSFRYAANHEAMVWFLRDVYPRIQHGQPNATLMITGDHANLPLPAATGVTLSGHVQDVRPAIAGAWCSIAPLQTGGGTRLKILEAMALGTPVVATSKGAEGLDVVDGVHLLIGDTPETFANAVERVLQEPELRQRLIDNARRLVYSEYEWTRVMPRFLDLVEWAAHDEPMRMEPLR